MSDFNQTLEVFVRQRVQELLPGAVNTALGNVFINVGKQLKEQAVSASAAPGAATPAALSASNPDRYKSQSEKMKENWIKRKAKAAAEKAAAAAAAGTPIPVEPVEPVSTETPEEAESTNEPVASEEPAE